MSEYTAPASPQRLNAFPVFMRVEGRVVVIVGNGEAALAKARLLAQSSAELVLVAPVVRPALAEWAAANGAALVREPYDAARLKGAALVFAATGDLELDRRIVADARAAGIPANAVDRPDLCDFYTPALVNRAPVCVAIGTEGAGPVLAQTIRRRIEAMLSPSLGALARLAAAYRGTVERLVPAGSARRRFWRDFFEGAPARAMEIGTIEDARTAAAELMSRRRAQSGHVALVGAGPGAEDLLTLRAQRLLMEADVIIHDALVPEAIVAMGRRDASRIAAGKRKGCHSKSQDEINALLVSLARQGKRVVRLKCGDPLVFGRAGEELAALRQAGIENEVVPGVTAAFAAAADFALPLTLRGVSSSLVFTTGHDLKGNALPDWARLAIEGATVAVYMGRSTAAEVAGRLIEAGLSPDTAVAVVENASLQSRRLLHGTLADLPALAGRSRTHRPGDDDHRRRGRRRGFREIRAARRARSRAGPGRGRMKMLTANRLIDGEAVWLDADGSWAETIEAGRIARDAHGGGRSDAGRRGCRRRQPGGRHQPHRRRDRRRHDAPAQAARAHPRGRPDHPHRPRQAGRSAASPRSADPGVSPHVPLRRVRPRLRRRPRRTVPRPGGARLAGEITEDQFKPLRLMNGVYLQLHAYMLRVAVPYGTLSPRQMRMLAHIARTYDKGYGHFTTRQNIQFNWPALAGHPGDPGRPRLGRDARHPDIGQLHPQRHGRPFRRRGRRRTGRSAALCRNPAAMVVGASRIFVPAAENSRSR